jgi:trehalose 6-phosphate phosphatase
MKEILRLIKPGRPLFLFLDYDGTLAPIARSPDRAVLAPRRKKILEALGGHNFVCIVSGRSLADIRRIVGLDGLAYCGNHGLEILRGGKTWVHPRALAARPALGRLLKRIEGRTGRFPRMLIEDKGVTGSVHFRRLDPALLAPLKRIVDEEVRRPAGQFIVTEGKRVLEIRPRLDWDKGRGIREILTRLPGEREALPVFIGDDRTDEDAFRELGPEAITIHVGLGRSTQARFRLPGVDQVWTFLGTCLRLARTGKSGSLPVI